MRRAVNKHYFWFIVLFSFFLTGADWVSAPKTNVGFGSSTLTPGGYSTIYRCRGDTAIMIEPMNGGAIAFNGIYQNAVLKLWINGSGGISRTVIDTLNWYQDANGNTVDSAHNATDPTPPPRHFAFACTDSGSLYTMEGLNTFVEIRRTFTSANVNTTSNEITLTGGVTPLSNLDRIRFATTNTLPAPLAPATDYYVIRISSTVIRVASSLANARSATAIDLTDGGTGTDTLRAYAGDHPSDVWRKDLVSSPATFTQLFPARDSTYVNNANLVSMFYDQNQRFFVGTPMNDQNSGSSQRSYLLRVTGTLRMSRLSQSYNNGDAPGVSSGDGCAFDTRINKGFCFGGGNNSNPTNRFWRFNDSTLLWDTLKVNRRPRARVQHGTAIAYGRTAVADSFWIVGGASAEGGTKYTDTWRCSIPVTGDSVYCDSIVSSLIPTAVFFSYLEWMPSTAKLVLRQGDGGGAPVDSFYIMAAGFPIRNPEGIFTPFFTPGL